MLPAGMMSRIGWLAVVMLVLGQAWGAPAEDETRLVKALENALPAEGTAYADLKWSVAGGGGLVSIEVRDPARNRLMLWGHALLHDQQVDPQSAGFTDKVAGRPAKRQSGRGVWLLAGRVELRLVAVSARFESDEALEHLAAAIRWNELERL